jgi:MFS family permease
VGSSIPPLSTRSRLAVAFAAIAGLLFDGVELGLMPVASLSVARGLLGSEYTEARGADWFAWLTASLMLGAAIGGIALGALGDRVGRVRALGISVLFYSIFAGLGAIVNGLEQLLLLRFLVGLGVGGVWPNAVALSHESWPASSRTMIAGLMGCSLNTGILLLSQVARWRPITADSWRWLFCWCAAPAALGICILLFLPESPRWLADRTSGPKARTPLRLLFQSPLLRRTLVGIVLGSVPLVGAWAASKWMVPWADSVGGTTRPGYKAVVQGWWALGAAIGSLLGSHFAGLLGRRRSYFVISLGATALTCGLFTLTRPLAPEFLPVVFLQGLVATLFFGWLPLYLPELFPTSVRATGSGVAYNAGRFATAIGVFAAGGLASLLGGDIARVGAIAGLIYALGMLAILWAPETSSRAIDEA